MSVNLRKFLEKCSASAVFSADKAVDVNDEGILGDAPLHLACAWNDVDAVRGLIQAGAHVNKAGDRGRTPLFEAAANDNVQIAKLLLSSGADKTWKDQEGKTAREVAILLGSKRVGDLLE